MRFHYKVLFLSIILLVQVLSLSSKDFREGNVIWFNEVPKTNIESPWTLNDFSTQMINPDSVWEKLSLPIGNGSFGGNILGYIDKERIILNEKSLWHGGPATEPEVYWDMNKKVEPEIISKIRNLIITDSINEAEDLLQEKFSGNINYSKEKFGAYSVLGEIYIETNIQEKDINDYKRILNIDNALALVEFKKGNTTYQRKYFASYPDSVMVWKFTSDGEPMNLTFESKFPYPFKRNIDNNDLLIYEGFLPDNNMQWALGIMIRSKDPHTIIFKDDMNGKVCVNNTTDVEFILAADTDYQMNFNPDFRDKATYVGNNPTNNIIKILESTDNITYDNLYNRHLEDFKELFDRVLLKINPDQQCTDDWLTPTMERLQRYKEGVSDYRLEEIYYQLGRYLLISSSRPGAMPANLQGIWHNNIDGPWRCDYHNNINIQMNYWPANTTNLTECFIPFCDYVRSLIKPGRKTAKDYFNARGWTTGISSNIFGFTAPLNSNQMIWNFIPTAGPWLATQLWDYYDFTRNKDWLLHIGYPIISESADFASDLLFRYGDYYTASPSYSPEHGRIDMGATFANAVIKEILKIAISAAHILKTDTNKIAEWQEKLDNISPYKIGKYGQFQEWSNDIDDPNDNHRHFNHLFAIHPGTTVNTLSDSTLIQAAKITLNQRGDISTGWSMAWKINQWARLFDGDRAYLLFRNLLKNSTAPNLWNLHPPFQIDGNFGSTAGITEMLLQSHNGFIHLLPALPSNWGNIKVSGIKARGNFTVDMIVKDGKLTDATIYSGSGEPANIYYNGENIQFQTKPGEFYYLIFGEDNNFVFKDKK